jgi:hypothetical protein
VGTVTVWSGASTQGDRTDSTQFAAALSDQRKRVAVRDLLASIPPMMAEQIQRSTPGNPPDKAIDALFKAMKSGEFVPSQEQLDATGCLIATTSRATDAFASADEMWATMREMLGAPQLKDAVRYTLALQQQETPADGIVVDPIVLDSVLGGPIPLPQLNWWETVIQLLLTPAEVSPHAEQDKTSASA